jgi:dipeptidyl aminopeptidase/acylaminoacyl peptidase
MYTASYQACARATLFGLLLIAQGSLAFGQSSIKPPVEAFGALPAVADVNISPDGKHFSALQTYQGRRIVVIYEVGAPAGTMPAILADDTHYILGARWASNDRLLVDVYQSEVPMRSQVNRAIPWVRTFSIDTKAQNLVMLFKNAAAFNNVNNTSIIADLNTNEPNTLIMPSYGNNITSISFDLYKVEVVTGMAEPFMKGLAVQGWDRPSTVHWIMDGKGHVVGRVDRSQEPLIDHLKLYKDGDWPEVASFDAEADRGAYIAGLTEDGGKIVRYETGRQAGTDAVVGYDLATAKTTTLFKDEHYDVGGLYVDDWTRRAIGVFYTADTRKVQFFEPGMQALQRGLEAAFPGNNVSLRSMDQARDRVIVQVSSTSEPHSYYLLDRKTHFAGRIGTAYPQLHPQDLGVVKPYPYKARDGLDIPAYITLPPGKVAKNLPAVVFPHGGPEARDSMDFDWWAQFMANRGYVVLQPNFRGSDGYGYAFRAAGFHQWGLKMQDDITDGVQKMIADGIVDPKRVCIVGASYGGYAALAGAAFTPHQYACAISFAGVSDLPKMLDSDEFDSGAHSKTMSYLDSRVGNVRNDSDRLNATSPALHADQVNCPVLLMHGQSDYTVRIEQSEEMYNALKRAGKQVEFIRFRGDEDHYLERAETRIQMLTEIEKFLAKNIGN